METATAPSIRPESQHVFCASPSFNTIDTIAMIINVSGLSH